MQKRLWTMIAVVLMSTGCNWVNRPIVYETAKETPPLEIPDDLIAPSSNPASQIPAASGVAVANSAAPPSLGNTAAVARSGLPRAADAILKLNDESASTWRRVGIALERSGCCKVVDRDESALTYVVEMTQPGERPGFFKRMFGADAPKSSMTVRVEGSGEQSQVTVVDASGDLRKDDLAMQVLGVVEERLK